MIDSQTGDPQSNKLPTISSSAAPAVADCAVTPPHGTMEGQTTLSANNPALPPSPSQRTSFYRARFLVIGTGRLIFAWGIIDTDKYRLGSIAALIPRSADFVSRHRDMGLAYAKARHLNKLYAAAEPKVAA
ncbi:MAG: hypothetical protein LAO09_11430 [Acidobacteriia bacterium]|nr:hypothetical protein [Terriglobia bacterium]